jgi:hypothetical protein
MDNEISQGVKIILERCKTNPEEMMDDYGKWGRLRDAVYDCKEKGVRQAWLRGLRQDEIDLLYEAFCTGARQIFDDYVLKRVLESDEEETLKYKTAGRYSPLWDDPRMLAQNAIQPIAVPPGSWQNVASQTSSTSIATQSLVARLKQELGIK